MAEWKSGPHDDPCCLHDRVWYSNDGPVDYQQCCRCGMTPSERRTVDEAKEDTEED